MIDRARMKLGHNPSGPTPHVPTLERLADLPPSSAPPADVDWTNGITDWPLLRNDELADCAVAGVLHYAQAAARWHDGVPLRASDSDAELGYRELGWAGKGQGSGARLIDTMTVWRQSGFTCAGHLDQIHDFFRVRITIRDLKAALWLAGPLLVGVLLPRAAASQNDWTPPPNLTGDNAPGSWGGHCMLLVAINPAGTCTFVTWGHTQSADPDWVTAYADEAWAPLHPTWLAAGRSPSGWTADVIMKDLAGQA